MTFPVGAIKEGISCHWQLSEKLTMPWMELCIFEFVAVKWTKYNVKVRNMPRVERQ